MEAKVDDRPYIEREWQCPVCHKSSTHHFLRDRTYVIQKQDADYFIEEYRWTKPGYNEYNLHAFYLWHCKFCLYTDEREAFFERKANITTSYIDDLKSPLLHLAMERAGVDIMGADHKRLCGSESASMANVRSRALCRISS